MIVSFTHKLFHPSIPSFPLTTYPALRTTGVLDIPAELMWRQCHTLHESAVYRSVMNIHVHHFGLQIKNSTQTAKLPSSIFYQYSHRHAEKVTNAPDVNFFMFIFSKIKTLVLIQNHQCTTRMHVMDWTENNPPCPHIILHPHNKNNMASWTESSSLDGFDSHKHEPLIQKTHKKSGKSFAKKEKNNSIVSSAETASGGQCVCV